ncbi:MAG: hypothetical protein ABIR50_06225, partial [Ginsengibacter sp.]
MKLFCFIGLFLFFCLGAQAQNDTTHLTSLHPEVPIFSTNDTVTRNDYLLSIEKIFQTLNKSSVLSQPVPIILSIADNLNDDDSAIAIIKERVNSNDKSLSIRNLQMLSIILKQINEDSKSYARQLNQYDSIFKDIKSEIVGLRKDTLIWQILKDSLLRASFKTQLLQLRIKWKKSESLLKHVSLLIDNTQARTSDNLITTNELQLQTQSLMKSTGSRIFGKESEYLWQFKNAKNGQSLAGEFKKSIRSERKITNYYFSHTHNQLLLLLFCGLIFFFWIFYNYKSLQRLDKTATLQSFNFRYINQFPVFASLILMLNLAPLFDLDAPFIYIATIEFLLMLMLTYSFWKRL